MYSCRTMCSCTFMLLFLGIASKLMPHKLKCYQRGQTLYPSFNYFPSLVCRLAPSGTKQRKKPFRNPSYKKEKKEEKRNFFFFSKPPAKNYRVAGLVRHVTFQWGIFIWFMGRRGKLPWGIISTPHMCTEYIFICIYIYIPRQFSVWFYQLHVL